MRRTTLAWLAHCLMYLSAVVFSGTVLSALLAVSRRAGSRLTIGLFVLGTCLLILALVLELMELLLAQETLREETEDILSQETTV